VKLSDISIHAFIAEHGIKTETGLPIDFKNHLFLFEPYRDLSPKQVVLKAAQIGFTTLEIIKSLWVAKNLGIDIIYTLPTESDVQEFAGGKVNRIIAQNPVFQNWVREKDSVEQKSVGRNLIYYRGTWTQKQAIMVSSDLNIYDEVDSSKGDVIEQYSTRLQHSRYKWEWYFSHPSAEGTGVDRYWSRSDQKHWFIRCASCRIEQYLSWPESINQTAQTFCCKRCGKELTDEERRKGRWVKKYKDREFSGYWIPLLICPWVSASEILNYHKYKSEEYFYNKVLGLPYVGGGNKLTKAHFIQNLTTDNLYPDRNERVVIGVDTGKQIHYVVGGEKGLFYYDVAKDYDEVERLLNRWPRSIVVVDQGGDLIGSRKLRESYPGRVFLCSYGEDRKTEQLVRWGAKDEAGAVVADRNRTIQLVVDEFTDKRIPVMGQENDWYDYWLHWNNLTRVKEMDEKLGTVKRKIWVRSGDDHWAHATTYWRVGMTRFASQGSVLIKEQNLIPNSYEIQPDDTVQFDPIKMMKEQQTNEDWRNV
jgi:hypothetical protein